jgi:ribosomal protein S18 acetylase RimI-like enzyme
MIRPAEFSDIPRMMEINVFAWRSAYRGIVSDKILFKNRTVMPLITHYQENFNTDTSERYVFDDGIIKAFMTVGTCRDEDKPDAFELGAIYVEPPFQRQKIGAAMAEFCENLAAQRGFKEICLWVLEENTSSRLFYEKQGYTTCGTTKLLENIGVTAIRYSKIL